MLLWEQRFLQNFIPPPFLTFVPVLVVELFLFVAPRAPASRRREALLLRFLRLASRRIRTLSDHTASRELTRTSNDRFLQFVNAD